MACANKKVLDTSNMAAKAVQISLDKKLLAKVDRDPQTKKEGRSAFMRAAIEHYLADKRRREIDEQIRRAYSDPAAVREQLEQVEEWLEEQVWPED